MLRSTLAARTSTVSITSPSPSTACLASIRFASSSSSSSSPKSYLPTSSQIHVVPFAIEPQDAQERLDWFSIPASYSAFAAASALAARYLPGFANISQIKRVGKPIAVYLPCWSLDGEIKVKAQWSGLAKGGKVVIVKAGWDGLQKNELTNGEDLPSIRTDVVLKTEMSFFPGQSQDTCRS